jgi:hypothetical protein
MVRQLAFVHFNHHYTAVAFGGSLELRVQRMQVAQVDVVYVLTLCDAAFYIAADRTVG